MDKLGRVESFDTQLDVHDERIIINNTSISNDKVSDRDTRKSPKFQIRSGNTLNK